MRRVERLGDVLHGPVIDDIEKNIGRPLEVEERRAMADHLWCEVLAQLAHAVDEGLKLVGKVPDRIADAVIYARRNADRSSLGSAIVKAAVKSVCKHASRLWFAGLFAKGETAVVVFRVLAVLMCKAPDDHRAVVEYCIQPLGDKLESVTKEWLADAFQDWLLPQQEAPLEHGRAAVLPAG